MNENELIYKSLPIEIKDDSPSMPHGGARGYGVVYGNWDSYKDVMAPGGLTNPDAFVKDGFMPVGHDWGGLPVGYIVDAKEDGFGLDVDFAYHSTQGAQDARTVAKERKLDRSDQNQQYTLDELREIKEMLKDMKK